MVLKILNLYCGIGGNRKLWGNKHQITAVELDLKIAEIYKDFFPEDNVIIADAHQYLLEHYKEFDFIWSSPPCPTHSRMRKSLINTRCGAKPIFPDMKLYEEILFLQGYSKGKWVVENVISWYAPLITPKKINRHFYWSNFDISDFSSPLAKFTLTNGIHKESDKQQVERLSKELGFDLSNFTGNKRTMLRNCVNPETGLHIFLEMLKCTG
jgi:DNA (cytosine-5)-methyltransferase 1